MIGAGEYEQASVAVNLWADVWERWTILRPIVHVDGARVTLCGPLGGRALCRAENEPRRLVEVTPKGAGLQAPAGTRKLAGAMPSPAALSNVLEQVDRIGLDVTGRAPDTMVRLYWSRVPLVAPYPSVDALTQAELGAARRAVLTATWNGIAADVETALDRVGAELRTIAAECEQLVGLPGEAPALHRINACWSEPRL